MLPSPAPLRPLPSILLLLMALALPCPALGQTRPYPWLERYRAAHSVARRIPPPAGCRRQAAPAGSFAAWLRGLPLTEGRPPVLLHNGQPKRNQAAHHAVVDIDVGRRDLQQCADAVMRLRAEYLYAAGKRDAIRFHFTSGDRADFAQWARGYRPVVRGNTVRWARSAAPDASYRSLRSYLTRVFIYAGTHSLSREMKPVRDIGQMQAGDVFVQGGFPGHAVLVADMAVHATTGRRCFLLAQSYMPAQHIHILRNPAAPPLSPWYPVDFGETLRTPEWTFRRSDLKRF